MNKDHKEKIETMFSYISMILTEQKYIEPVFILIINEEIRPIVIKSYEELSISEYIKTIYQTIKKETPDALLFICTRWMLITHKDEPITKLLNDDIVRVEDQEDKELYLTLQYMSPKGDNEALIAKIESDLVGTLYTKSQNWISNFFPNIVNEWNQ